MATLNEVAKRLDREPNVISLQTACMEKDGLIKRTKNTPKSNLLKLELTDKGLDIINTSQNSESIISIFSALSRDERQQLDSLLDKILVTAQKYRHKINDPDNHFKEM